MNLGAVNLLWIHVALTGPLGVILVLISLLRPGTRLIRGTGLALVALSAANASFGVREIVSAPASILLGTGLALLAGLLMQRTVSAFVQRSLARPDITGWLVAAFTFAWVAWFTHVKPDLIARMTLLFPVAAFFVGRLAWQFGVYSRGESGTPLSDVLTGCCGFSVSWRCSPACSPPRA